MRKNLIHQFSTNMSRLVQKINALDRTEKGCYGVTISQIYTIDAIYKNEKITMNEWSKQLGIAISTLTRIIDVLVRDGIVNRNQSEQDRRKVNINLSNKGKELAKKLEQCSEKFWCRIFKQIPNDKKK